ncbi:MAG: hypothetical protein N3E38_02135 [Candidatus Aenigmarchaeota archaeon]|nr:hypothetical protein [Candidatus Aenigmarchaeota archaeon]
MRFLLILLLILPSVSGLNLGGFVKNEYIEAREHAAFEIIIWSEDEDSVIVLNEKDIPQGIRVEVVPRLIDQKTEGIYIAKDDGLIKAHRVVVFVNASQAKPGLYVLKISAFAYKGMHAINVMQEREFDLKLKVVNGVEINESLKEKKAMKNIDVNLFINFSIILITMVIVIFILRKQ